MGRQKKIDCRKCFKNIRSDNLKEHIKVYEHMINNEVGKEFIENHVGIAPHQNDAISCTNKIFPQDSEELKRSYDDIRQTESLNIISLRKSIDKDDQENQNKIELGRVVFIYLHEAEISQESLSFL